MTRASGPDDWAMAQMQLKSRTREEQTFRRDFILTSRK
jgi:hypothetical protein